MSTGPMCCSKNRSRSPMATRFRLHARATAWSGTRRRSSTIACAELAKRQLEQLDCVAAADFDAVGLADVDLVEPLRAFTDVLERPVDRKHHAVGTHHGHGVDQRRRVEIAGCRQMEMLAEIVCHALLGRVFMRRLHPAIAIVDAPEIDGDAFADVTEYDLQIR